MVENVATSGPILVGILLLAAAIFPITRILLLIHSPGLRRSWIGLGIMIAAFMIAYAMILPVLAEAGGGLGDLLPPLLLLGAVFVLSVAHLSAQTAADVARLVHLERQVIVDPLTGAYNRRYLDAQLASAVALAARSGSPLSLCVIDLDHFKTVNDRFGHPVGDQVLSAVANILSREVRQGDTLARYGGEEFVIVAPMCDAAQASAHAQRLCAMLRAARIPCPGGPLTVTASIGSATLAPGESAAGLLARADAALYTAKNSGRDRAVDAAPPGRPAIAVAAPQAAGETSAAPVRRPRPA